MDIIPDAITYGFILNDSSGHQLYAENAAVEQETASAIKSAIGTVALLKAAGLGHDPELYTIRLDERHASNGSGVIKHNRQTLPRPAMIDNRAVDGSCVTTLEDLLWYNIVESDCVATNGLIDYIGGKDRVNDAFRARVGLESMQLVSDRLHFPGVDHIHQPFQVGRSNMEDYITYYRTLWPETGSSVLPAELLASYTAMHLLVKHARMFGKPQIALPRNTQWFHKTGSALNTRPNEFYGLYVDAGMMIIDGKRYFAASGMTAHAFGPSDGYETETVEAEFTRRNVDNLAAHGIDAGRCVLVA